VGALEATLRLLVDRYRCDPRLGWTYRPGARVLVFNWSGEFVHFVRFNRDGLRDDREAPAGPDAGAFRIAVLGDSFSAGLQVPADGSFSRQLEARLGAVATPGRRIEVWNAAVDGFGTAQALQMFGERVARYRPNVVLLGLFLANDLGDNVREGGSRNHYLARRCGRPYFELNGSGRVRETRAAAPADERASWLDRTLRRSELYANLVPVTDQPAGFGDWDVFTGKKPGAVDAAWRLTRELVRELGRQVQAHGGRLAVVLMPNEREARVGVDPPDRGIDFDRAHAMAEDFLRQAGIPFIDLYPALRTTVARGDRPYLTRDMHWSSRGHEVVVESIQGWLVSHCAELGLPVTECRA
jgi:lysophospholipase L1-like esterase